MPAALPYSTSLARSLVDRAGNLGEYIDSVQAANSGADGPYSIALDLFRNYTERVIRQTEIDIDLGQGRHLSDILQARLRDLFQKEKLFDERFARGSQSHVPRALQTLARRELRLLGLVGYEAVLTVGPSGSFETHRADLESFLFSDFRGLQARPPGRRPRIAVISVPYVEGSRALWFPICLGHEIGHVRIEHFRGSAAALPDYSSDIDDTDVEIERLIELDTRPGESGLGRVEDLRQVMRQWTEELSCDINAVRAYGPAGMTAITEFIASLRPPAEDVGVGTPQQASKSHPSLNMRVRMMTKALAHLGFRGDAAYISDAKNHAAATEGELSPVAEYLSGLIDHRSEDLITHVLSWGERAYDPSHFDRTASLAKTLSSGIPGRTHFTDGATGQLVRTTVADVINASWMSRDRLDRSTPTDVKNPKGGSKLDLAAGYAARVSLDNLSSKAIDDLEFCSLWRMAGRKVSRVDRLEVSEENTNQRAGVLSRRSIVQRLQSEDSNSQLIVTPLLDGAIQDAGLDLRLGADFIVFRHSAISEFDPIGSTNNLHGRSDDPRRVQEGVTKAWGEPFILHPNQLVLAATLEYIVLPADVSGQVVTRSSYGRLGLITATAVQVQPGSRNCITLELVNHGPVPISLMPGARIAQLVLSTLTDPVTASPGKYWYPTGPEFSKVRRDSDSAALRKVSTFARYVAPSPQMPADMQSIIAFNLSAGVEVIYVILRVFETNGFEPRMMPLESGVDTYSIDISLPLTGLLRVLPEILGVSGLVIHLSEGSVRASVDAEINLGTCRLLTNDGREQGLDVENQLESILRSIRLGVAGPDGRWSE